MLDKKSKNEVKAASPSASSFSPFTNLRKSFRRLKAKRLKRALSHGAENNQDTNINSNSSEKRNFLSSSSLTSKNNKCSKYENKITKKNSMKVKFNIVEWSSCESMSDSTLKSKSRKHNSLRRSKASLLMPLSPEGSSIPKAKKLIISQTTKINRYNSVDVLNHTNLVESQNKWFSSQSFVESKDINSSTLLNKDLPDDQSPDYEESKLKKLQKKRKRHRHSLSLPNIHESEYMKTVEPLSCKKSVITNIDNHNNRLNNKNPANLSHCTRTSQSFDEGIIESVNLFDNKRFSLRLMNNSMYTSSISLARPPLPSVPKPINKRDRHLKSASMEHLSSRKSVHNPTDFKKQLVLLSKPFSDSQYQEFKKDFSEMTCNHNGDVESVKPKNKFDDENISDDPKNASLNNEGKWMEILSHYQLPLAVAEAVFDHTSLQKDELTFSSGDVITVLFMEDENWWWGCARCDQQGWFPASYVRLRVVQELDTDDSDVHSSKSDLITCSIASKISLIGLQSKANDKDKSMTVRAKCVEELLNTEIEYVKLLKNIIVGYLTKVREDNLFTNEDADVIFSNIEQLYEFHKEFVQELKHAVNMEAMENSNVGEVFLRNQSKFEIYSNYCNNQPRSSARLSALTKTKKIEFFMESCRLRQNMIRLSLDGFLLSPVQRICKYPLQLKELLKHTKNDHPDYNSLMNARSCMQNVASFINERKRRLENVNKLAKWQLSVSHWKDDDLVLKSSDLIFKGVLNKLTNGKIIERHVYLFDHQLLYFKSESVKRTSLTYRGRIHLDNASIENVNDCTIATSRGDHVANAWRIWCNLKKKWYIFHTSSKQEKEEWMKAFENERNHVKDEEEKGFKVLHEVRLAAMENAYNKHITDLKRNRMRRKSIATSQIDQDLLILQLPEGKSPEKKVDTAVVDTGNVTKRTNKAWRNRSFRLSFQGNEKKL